MIISHRHKFIFAAIPKTGTHSVRRALREHLGPDDLEQVGLFVQKKFPDEELAALKHGHLSFAQVRRFVGEEAFAGYLKFAFVRNPFDRFVSYCAFMTRETGLFEREPQRVMGHFLFEKPPRQHILFRPQHSFVTDEAGVLQADEIGRVETMQASYEAICARLGIPTAALEQANSSRHDDYRGYYDQTLIDGVAALYGRDLELFGYSF
ncbi:MAG: sulfotransferase family 2 domain-containing protein [Hyphomonadaceae bacterium]